MLDGAAGRPPSDNQEIGVVDGQMPAEHGDGAAGVVAVGVVGEETGIRIVDDAVVGVVGGGIEDPGRDAPLEPIPTMSAQIRPPLPGCLNMAGAGSRLWVSGASALVHTRAGYPLL